MLALLATAFAQEADAEATTEEKRDFLMEVNFRGRYMHLPDAFLDIGLESHRDDGVPDRPTVNAYTLGLEFVVKGAGQGGGKPNGIFYIEYIGALMDEGYWDDKDSEPDHNDGSWIVPKNFGLFALGADYASEFEINHWFSFMAGAGLGLGIVIGELEKWEVGEPDSGGDNTDWECGSNVDGEPEAAYGRVEHCESDGTLDIPPVLPILDVNVGVRFNINNRASIRLEGGVHNLLYGGAAVGIVF